MKKECWNCVHSEEPSGNGICATCFSKYDLPPSNWSAAECWKPTTNADRIRSMTDEELALLLIDGCRGGSCEGEAENEYGSINCIACRMKWLQQPAEEDT